MSTVDRIHEERLAAHRRADAEYDAACGAAHAVYKAAVGDARARRDAACIAANRTYYAAFDAIVVGGAP